MREAESIEEFHWKVRIALLWIFLAVSTSTHSLLAMMQPGVIDQVTAGRTPDGGMDLGATFTIMVALFWLVPLTMAFLTLVLKDTINRPANIVLGLLASVLWLSEVVEGVGIRGEFLMLVGTVVAGLLISWHGWKWPRSGRAVATPSS